MAAQDLHLSVVAPDRSVVEEQVISVIAPGVDGYIGVMAGHTPLIASLKPGLLEFLDRDQQRHYVHIGGGFAEINGVHVTILADEAMLAKDIDIANAERLLEEARRQLATGESELSNGEAQQEIERAVNRLKAARLAQK